MNTMNTKKYIIFSNTKLLTSRIKNVILNDDLSVTVNLNNGDYLRHFCNSIDEANNLQKSTIADILKHYS